MTRVRTYRIDINDEAQYWDAIVVANNWEMTSQHLGTAASLDNWTCPGNVPTLDVNWKLWASMMPEAVMKKCVYDPQNKNADAFDYCNMTNTPEIPVVNDPTITFLQGWINRWSISLNQASWWCIELMTWWVEAWCGIDITCWLVNVKYDNSSIKLNDWWKLTVDNYSCILSWAEAWATAVQPWDLATVATTGDYNDLINKPSSAVWWCITGTLSEQTDLQWELTCLNDRLDNVESRWKFLALWDATTWLAMSNPTTSPYTYHTWDYFVVWKVWTTNYRPTWSSYTIWVPSTEIETDELTTDDVYYYDWDEWKLQVNHGKTVSFSNLTWQPSDNSNLWAALDSKLDKVTTASIVYGTDGSWNPLTRWVATGAINNTIPLRTAWWTLSVWTPTADAHATTKKYVDDLVATKWSWDMLKSTYDPNNCNADVFNYNNLYNKPTIPATLNSWCAISISSNKINVNYDNSTIKKNDWNCLYADYTWLVTEAQLSSYAKCNDLSSVATSWCYCDLVWLPDLTCYQTTWNMVTTLSWADHLHYPTAKTVADALSCAGTGDMLKAVYDPNNCNKDVFNYNNLSNKPTIPTDNCQLANSCWYITSSAINTKTFVLSSSSDLSTASNAVEYINWWNNAVIILNNTVYTLYSKTATSFVFRWPSSISAWTSDTQINQASLTFTVSWNTVTAISTTSNSLGKYLETDRNYATPLTPTYNGSPATKKYVDDCVWAINSAEWWCITGTLSNQTDLNTCLNAKLEKTTAASDCKWLYNWQTINAVISWTGISNSTNLLSNSVPVAIRGSISNPFIWLQDSSGNKYYLQSSGWYMYFWPTSTKAMKFDANWNADFLAGSVTAKNWFIKTGGTSSQFLKADGSVDSTSYATTTQLNSKQDTLTAWTGIDITNNVISATSTGWMQYEDFNFQTKSWASFNLSLSSEITPTANFTVNVPTDIKEWQTYVLRINSWDTPYTMSLGTNVENPFGVDLTLTPNGTDQFVFFASSDTSVELQKDWDDENVFVTQEDYDALPSTKATDGKTYFIFEEAE